MNDIYVLAWVYGAICYTFGMVIGISVGSDIEKEEVKEGVIEDD